MSIHVNDPEFHQRSYDQGYQDGESSAVADYSGTLDELGGFDWPAENGFYPSDVAAVVANLAELVKRTEQFLWRLVNGGAYEPVGRGMVDEAKQLGADLRAVLPEESPEGSETADEAEGLTS